MAVVTEISGVEILDSRGVPTLEVTVEAGESHGVCRVPSGKSTGIHEAKELRDADGRGVTRALSVLADVIRPALIGTELSQRGIDTLMLSLDGTKDRSRLGGNTLIGVSEAVARAVASDRGVPLWRSIADELGSEPGFPKLYMNLINGGVHADFAAPFQEYMVVISGEPGVAYAEGQRLFRLLGEHVRERYGEVPMGDEGGYAPRCTTLTEPFDILSALITDQTTLAIDAAASELYSEGAYSLLNERQSAADLLELYQHLVDAYPLRSIEDPFEENDTASFVSLTARLAGSALVVGDDLTVTNPERLTACIDARAATALIVKPNQVGTITETYEVIRRARKSGWQCIVSHRSGDTLDSFVADLAVGAGAYGIKAGSPHPPERRVKYERLIEIAEQEMIR